MKQTGLMNQNELALNRNDLSAYVQGQTQLDTMIPGILNTKGGLYSPEQTTRKSETLASPHSPKNRDKFRRL